MLFACSFRFLRFVARFVCFWFVVFCFASFRFLFALLADATNLYVWVFVSLHFVCLASFRFVLLRFPSFASLLLFFFVSCLFQFSLSCKCFLCFRAMVFICMGLHYNTRAGQPVMVCACLCLGVVVYFVLFHLLFVCVLRACYF